MNPNLLLDPRLDETVRDRVRGLLASAPWIGHQTPSSMHLKRALGAVPIWNALRDRCLGEALSEVGSSQGARRRPHVDGADCARRRC
jgi:hypothetical protein